MSEEAVKNFLFYLEDIGLINNIKAQNLLNVYYNLFQNSNDKNFTNLMCATLMFFFNNMNEDEQKFSSLNLILKYLNKQNEEGLGKIKNTYDNIEKENKNETMQKLSQYNNNIKNNNINKNKINNLNNTPQTSLKIKSSTPKKIQNINIDENSNKNNKSIRNTKNNSDNSNLLETSWDKKEREEYEQCTFEPLINKRSSTNNNQKIPIYERLYSYNNIYKNRKEMKINEKEKKENEDNSFQPKIISTPQKFRNKSKNTFEDRQKLFFDYKNRNQAKLMGQIDKDFNNKCSFSPKVNSGKQIENYYNNNNDISSPVHLRLYEDDQKRRNKNKLNEQNNLNTPLVDYEKLEELYNQYKNKPALLQKIKEKVENEEGITFQPYINKNNYYSDKVKTDFYERNMQMIASKKKFINDYNQREQENFRRNQLYSDKRYTQNEKEEITKRIIDRLYGENGNNYNNLRKKDDKSKLKDDEKYIDKIMSLDDYNKKNEKK